MLAPAGSGGKAKLGENISVRRFARFKIGDPTATVAQAKVAPATEEAAS
jgi:elongation factor Ts